MRPSQEPVLSVVVPFVNDLSDLRYCLSALAREQTQHDLEVLVVDRKGTASQAVPAGSPWVRILPAEPTASIPEMRALAFAAARAPSVAVIEDHVGLPEGWVAGMLAARAEGAMVVGGAVRNAATERLVDWAAFLCEYSQLLPPIPAGPVEGLPGNNTVYARELLQKHLAIVAGGGWENRLHQAIRRDGVVLVSRPDLVVDHKMHYSVWLYTSQRYLFSRSYAEGRTAGAPFAKRALMGLAALALPPVLFWRVVSTVVRKGHHRRELLLSLPLLAWFTVAWAAGEMAGFWFGPGGASAKVR